MEEDLDKQKSTACIFRNWKTQFLKFPQLYGSVSDEWQFLKMSILPKLIYKFNTFQNLKFKFQICRKGKFCISWQANHKIYFEMQST